MLGSQRLSPVLAMKHCYTTIDRHRIFYRQAGLERHALYLHDYSTWIGLRLAMRDPSRITKSF